MELLRDIGRTVVVFSPVLATCVLLKRQRITSGPFRQINRKIPSFFFEIVIPLVLCLFLNGAKATAVLLLFSPLIILFHIAQFATIQMLRQNSNRILKEQVQIQVLNASDKLMGVAVLRQLGLLLAFNLIFGNYPLSFGIISRFPSFIKVMSLISELVLFKYLSVGFLLNSTQSGRRIKRRLNRNVKVQQMRNKVERAGEYVRLKKEESERRFEEFKFQLRYHRKHPEGKINRFIQTIKFKPTHQSCGSCLENKTQRRLIKLSNCGHKMCYPCLQSYIATGIAEVEGTDLECPYDPEECPQICSKAINKALQSMDPTINAVLMKQQLDAAFVRKGILSLQNIAHCPSADCQNLFYSEEVISEETFMLEKYRKAKERAKKQKKGLITPVEEVKIIQMKRGPWEKVDDVWIDTRVPRKERKVVKRLMRKYKATEDGVDLRKFKCSSCNFRSCVVCKKAWIYGLANHDQLSCERFHHVAKLDEADPATALTEEGLRIKKAKGIMKDCPKCGMFIEKNKGCKHMTCINCKHQFCWKCLAVWGQCTNCRG